MVGCRALWEWKQSPGGRDQSWEGKSWKNIFYIAKKSASPPIKYDFSDISNSFRAPEKQEFLCGN